MGDKIKEYVIEGFNSAVNGFIQSIKDGIRSALETLGKSYQFAIIDFALFVALALIVFYCYSMIIGNKATREKAAGRLYWTFISAFVFRIAYALLLK